MHITANDISLIRFDLPIVEGSAPNQPKCNTHIHIRNTCTLDRCKQKRKKEERKGGEKKKRNAFFSAIHNNCDEKKFGNNFWRREGGKKKKSEEKFTVFIRVGYTKDKLYRTRSIGECSPRSNRATYTRWPFTVDPQKTITAQSILPVLLFNALDPRRRCLRNAITSVVYRAYSIHSLVDPRDHRSFRTRITRDSTTHKPSFSFLWALLDCLRSTPFTNDNILVSGWYLWRRYVSLNVISHILNVSRGKEEKEQDEEEEERKNKKQYRRDRADAIRFDSSSIYIHDPIILYIYIYQYIFIYIMLYIIYIHMYVRTGERFRVHAARSRAKRP